MLFITFKKELKSFLFGLSFCLWQRILFIDYVQRSSSSLYRILRYRNCLNYITLQIIHSPPRGVSREWGVALYGAYAADFNLDSSAFKDAVVDCSTTWDGSELQSPTVRTAKECRNACVEEPTARNLCALPGHIKIAVIITGVNLDQFSLQYCITHSACS